jgi:hypothetical protein
LEPQALLIWRILDHRPSFVLYKVCSLYVEHQRYAEYLFIIRIKTHWYSNMRIC